MSTEPCVRVKWVEGLRRSVQAEASEASAVWMRTVMGECVTLCRHSVHAKGAEGVRKTANTSLAPRKNLLAVRRDGMRPTTAAL